MVSIKKKITALAVIAAIALIAYLFFAYRIITNPTVERKIVIIAIVLMAISGASYARIMEMAEEKRSKRIMGIVFGVISVSLSLLFLNKWFAPRTDEILKYHMDWLSDLKMLSNIHMFLGISFAILPFIKKQVLEDR